jgi:5-methylcytosine-specific restriction endonuclease McrA
MPYTGRQHADYQLARLRRNREAFFAGKCCAKCGSTRNLELDHKDPAVKVTHLVWAWGEKRRKAELAKCQILCSRCHKRKTAGERRARAQEHGASAYRSGRCRCGICRKAHAARQLTWKRAA